MILFGGSEVKEDDSTLLAAADVEELSGSVFDPAPLPSAEHSESKPGVGSELFRVLTKAVEELGVDWSSPEEYVRSCLDEWFLSRRHRPLVSKLYHSSR